MKRYLSKGITSLALVIIAFPSVVVANNSPAPITASLIGERNTAEVLVQRAKRTAPAESQIDVKQLVQLKYAESNVGYLVPVIILSGDQRGCYLYSFDQDLKASQTVLVSAAEELESCELITAIFSCNRHESSTSGIGVLYGKRLGADHYSFEGSYFAISESGVLSERKDLSARMTDLEKVASAKKKLGCR
jgi:hypothetical protein